MKNLLKWTFLLIAVCLVHTTAQAIQGGGRTTATPNEPARPGLRERRRIPRREPRAASVSKPVRPIPPATLNIKSFPTNCIVLLNGKPVGATDAAGYLRVEKLKPGQYILIARRQDYRDEQRTVQINVGQEALVEISLAALPGTINVIPNVAGANININSIGDFTGQVTNYTIAPGAYRIEVTKPGYQKATRTIEVAPAKFATLEVPLEPLPTDQALAQAEQYLHARDYAMAAAVCDVVLMRQPNNPQATLLTGYSHYYAGRHSQSLPFLFKALTMNQQVSVPVRYYQKVSSRDTLIPGQLTLRLGTFGFRPDGGGGFSAPASKVYDLKIEPKNGGRIYTQVGISQNSSTKEKKEKFYFHPAAAFASPPGSKSVIECANCQQELLILFQLIQRTK
jgi:hypothetical protein